MSRSAKFDPSDMGDWPVPKDCELLDGQIVETATGAYKAWCSGQLFCALNDHCEANDVGWVFPSQLGYRFFPGRAHLRKTAVSVVRKGKFPGNRLSRGDATIPPDLAAHFIAPGETAYFVQQKVVDFLTYGTRLFWLVDVESRTSLVFRPDGSARFLREQEYLDGEDVIPGFRCRLGDLFEQPEADRPLDVPVTE